MRMRSFSELAMVLAGVLALAGCGDRAKEPAASMPAAAAVSSCNPKTLEGCSEEQKGAIGMLGKSLDSNGIRIKVPQSADNHKSK
jgi:hypothetical protein